MPRHRSHRACQRSLSRGVGAKYIPVAHAHPSPTATAPAPALSPSYSAPSPLSLLQILQLYIPDSSRRICRFHLGFSLATLRGNTRGSPQDPNTNLPPPDAA